MKKIFWTGFMIPAVCLFSACNTDEKPIETVLQAANGAFLRTIQINECEFHINDPDSMFSIMLEEQDVEEGALMELVNVYVEFLDNTVEQTDYSSDEILLRTMTPEDFSPGNFGLPVVGLDYSFQELMDATGVSHGNVSCKDQFLIRLELKISTGFTFSTGNASACVLAFDTFFSSPFLYTINVVEPIDPDTFTGTYFYNSILDGPFGPTFGEPFLVEVSQGHSNNVREVRFDNVPNRLPRPYRFSIACDETIFEKNQVRYRTVNISCGENGQPILLGPDIINATIDADDDSVFEIWFAEGYLGFDGGAGFGTLPSRIRLNKQ